PKRDLLAAVPKPAQIEPHHSSVAGHPLALEDEEALAGDARSVGHEVRSPRTKMIGAASDLLPIRDEAVEKRVAHLLARLERTSGRDGVRLDLDDAVARGKVERRPVVTRDDERDDVTRLMDERLPTGAEEVRREKNPFEDMRGDERDGGSADDEEESSADRHGSLPSSRRLARERLNASIAARSSSTGRRVVVLSSAKRLMLKTLGDASSAARAMRNGRRVDASITSSSFVRESSAASV